MEERARLKALEALFDPTTTARIVALPAAGEVVIAVEASPVSQYDLMMISGNYGYRRHLPAMMGTEGVGRAIAVGNAANDAVEQALSTTRLAELVRGGGYIGPNLGILHTFGDVWRDLVHSVHLYRGDTHCQP